MRHVEGVVTPEAVLQDPHARQRKLVAQSQDRRRHRAEILRDERKPVGMLLRERREHFTARLPAPRTASGVSSAGRHLVGPHEADEVVDPHEVEPIEGAPDPLPPPEESVAPMRRPPVVRRSPELPILREGVRRHAGDDLGAALAVEPEEFRRGMHIRRIERGEDRHVAKEHDAPRRRLLPQPTPLPIEAPLAEGMERVAPAVARGGEGGPARQPPRRLVEEPRMVSHERAAPRPLREEVPMRNFEERRLPAPHLCKAHRAGSRQRPPRG